MRQTVLITIMSLSVVLQFVAAFMALRLIRISGVISAWTLIAGAMATQGVRRVIAIQSLLATGERGDMTIEVLGLVISILMLFGILLIKPLFEQIHRAKQEQLDYQASLKEKNLALENEVTLRKYAEEESERLSLELQQLVIERTTQLKIANQEMEAFAYSVSHDLRSPLRSIDGFSLVLLDDYGDKLDDAGKDSLRRVRAATQRMAQLIDDMLKLSRISRSELNFEKVNLSEMAASLADELRSAEPERKVEFIIKKGVAVTGDPTLLRLVLDNLLDNAWKFTGGKTDARIEFGTSDVNGVTACFVSDNGVGFDMQYAGKLFETFHKLHTEQEFVGTGIGLSLVRHIIHRHGGTVWAEGAVGQGATFWFTLG